MINEDRLCLACHLPIVEMSKAVLVPNKGANQMYHRACLERMVGEAPTTEPDKWGALAVKGRVQSPARKAASESQPVSSTQCLVCHRGTQPGEDVATIGNATGHVSCLMELAKLLGRPPEKPDQARKSYERSLVNKALSMYSAD